jgi:hypothetical protein
VTRPAYRVEAKDDVLNDFVVIAAHIERWT